MDYLLLIFVSVALTAIWFKYRLDRKSDDEEGDPPVRRLSDDEVFQQQADFESRLVSEVDLPDCIRGRDAFIYWNLMSVWFSRLAAESRYDDERAQKLRRDWCDYLELLPRLKSARLMALESDDEAKAATYERDAEAISKSIDAIQDAFAAAIGGKGVEELRAIRSRDADAFDRSGRLPMASIGHHYLPVSINPYIEKCQPKCVSHLNNEA